MFQAFLKMLPADGMYCVAQKTKSGEMKEKFYKITDLEQENFAGMKNVFFTPNQLSYRYDQEAKKPTLRRNKQHLNHLCALYVDIDFKDSVYDVPPTVEEVLAYSETHIFGSELPEPTMIVSSGNGIHMYWVINPVSWKSILDWNRVQRHIYEVYRNFGADSCVCNDAVRLLRIPDTLNVKESGKKECKLLFFKKNKYELNALIEEFDIAPVNNIISLDKKRADKENRAPRTGSKEVYKGKPGIARIMPLSTLYSRRAKDLEILLLKYWDMPKGGNREKILFLYRYLKLQMLGNESDALFATLELNNRLTNKLTEKEVVTATSSAEKYYQGTQLNWKTSTYVEFLNITDEQARSLKTLLTPRIKAERASKRYDKKLEAMRSIYRASVGTMKADKVFARQCEVYQMYIAGYTAEQIMNRLEISKSTCYRDIQIIRTAEWLERYEQASVCAAQDSYQATGTDGMVVAAPVMVNTVSGPAGNTGVTCSKIEIPKNSAPYNYGDVMGPAPSEPVSFRYGSSPLGSSRASMGMFSLSPLGLDVDDS